MKLTKSIKVNTQEKTSTDFVAKLIDFLFNDNNYGVARVNEYYCYEMQKDVYLSRKVFDVHI